MGRKRSTNNKKLLTVITVILVCITGLCAALIKGDDVLRPDESPFSVSFIDVGQGDCELICCEGYNVLIDGGESGEAYKVSQYIKSMGVDKIDCYILTHPHSDHIGAAAGLIRSFSIEKIIMTSFSEFNIPTTKTYENMLSAIASSDAEVSIAEVGETYKFGALSLIILSPVDETDDYNDMSIVIKASYKDTSFLFMGDASSDIEKEISDGRYNISADVIKIGHHGSSSATSDKFIKTVNPDFAVISCGADNAYGHPHKEALNILTKNGVDIYRTDLNGTVMFYGDGKALSVRCTK